MANTSERQKKIDAYATELLNDGMPEYEARSRARAAYSEGGGARGATKKKEKEKNGSRTKKATNTSGQTTTPADDDEALPYGVMSRLNPELVVDAALHMLAIARCLNAPAVPDPASDTLLKKIVPLVLAHKRRSDRDRAIKHVLVAVGLLRNRYQKYLKKTCTEAQLKQSIEVVLRVLGEPVNAASIEALVPRGREALRTDGADQTAARAISKTLGLGKAGRNIYNWREKFDPLDRQPVAYGAHPQPEDLADFFLQETLTRVPAAEGDERERLKAALDNFRTHRLIARAREAMRRKKHEAHE